jgi:GxxExxY protein
MNQKSRSAHTKARRREESPEMRHPSLSDEEEQIGKVVVDSAFAVHSELGPGLLEKIYETCLEHELKSRGLAVERQVKVGIRYKDLELDDGMRLDLLIEGKVICELKAVSADNDLFKAQLLTYMKLTDKRLGYLINFNVPRIKDGISRLILRI